MTNYWEMYDTTEPIARKGYDCDACHLIHDFINEYGVKGTGLSCSELRTYIKAKRNGFKIKPGEKYNRVHGVYDGIFQTYRSIPAIEDICREHDLACDE